MSDAEPHTPPGRRRERLLGLLLGAVGLAVGLLAGELMLRLLRPQAVLTIPDEMYALEGEGRFGLSPGFSGTITNRVEFRHRVTVNEMGLRGQDPVAVGDSLEIVALGDSFTFGIGVEDGETWPARLEEALSRPGVPADVHNLGVPGYGAPEAVARLERLGAMLRPRLILLALFVGNDLQEAAEPDAGIHRGLIRRGGAKRSAGFQEWLYYHSHLFVFLKTALPTGPYEAVRARLGMGESGRSRRLRREMEVYRTPPGEVIERGREATDKALGRLVEVARELDASLAAMIIPDVLQLHPERWRASLDQLGLDPRSHDPGAPARILAELLDRHGIPTITLAAAFREAERRGERINYPIDRHWTPSGHDLAARELAAFVAGEGILLPEAAVAE